MERDKEREREIVNALVLMYDRILKSLLCYEDSKFTKELAEYMFDILSQFSEKFVKYPNFYDSVLMNLERVFIPFLKPNDSNLSSNLFSISFGSTELLRRVESFVILCYQSLFDIEGNEEPKDYRSEFGKRFSKFWNEDGNPYRGKIINNAIIIRELRNVTDHRNNFSHNLSDGKTGTCDGYECLLSYNTILAFLLYGFYHMMMSKCEVNFYN